MHQLQSTTPDSRWQIERGIQGWGGKEKMDLKRELFKNLESLCQENCILATNTSSLSIGEIASVTKRILFKRTIKSYTERTWRN